MSTENKITLKKQTSQRIELTIVTDPVDFDLTDYTLIFQIKKTATEDPLVEKTDIPITDRVATIDLSPEDTDFEGEYIYGTRIHKDEFNSYPYIDDELVFEPSVVQLPVE